MLVVGEAEESRARGAHLWDVEAPSRSDLAQKHIQNHPYCEQET